MSRFYPPGIKELLKRIGANRTVEELAGFKDTRNRGALHYAAGDGLTDACKYLLERLKFDVNVEDRNGTTPLAIAVDQGHTATAKYLVDYGAAIQTRCGMTALHRAAGNGDVELIKFLLAGDVSANTRNASSGTPLESATHHGQQDAVKLLLEYGANPNGHPEDGMTPVEAAVCVGSSECLELLIKAGADVNVAFCRFSPLHNAAYGGHLEIINCLLQAGANPNSTSSALLACENDFNNITLPRKPIEWAATEGNEEVVKILFPITKPIDHIQEWSVDGIMEQMAPKFVDEEEYRASQNVDN